MLGKLKFFTITLLLATLIPITGMNESAFAEAVVTEDLPTTGFEDRDGTSWTTLEEEEAFLHQIADMSDRVTYSQYGTSEEGRPLYLMKMGLPHPSSDEEIANGRKILIMNDVHGNEPAPREAVLKLIRDVAFTDDPEIINILSNSTVLFIPTSNPDARKANTRQNANGFDVNRDHLKLETAEAQAIERVLNKFHPEILVGAHERPGVTAEPDMEMLWPRNFNVDEQLRQLNIEMVQDYLRPDVEEAGFTTGLYGRAPYSGSGSERILRNMGGLRHSMTLLTESAGGKAPEQRVEMQLRTMESVLSFYHERFDDIGEIVSGAPERSAQAGANQDPFYLDGTHGWDQSKYPPTVLDPAPTGYLLTKDQAAEVDRQIDLFSLETESAGNYGVVLPMSQPMRTIIPLLADEGGTYNEVAGIPLYNNSTPGTAANLNEQVEHYKNEGAFSNPKVSRTLNMHLTAVAMYEKADEADKVVKHMETFKLILDQYNDTNVITDEAYNNLSSYADFIIEKWSAPELPKFDSAKAMKHLEHLAVDIGIRSAGTEGERQAAAYISNELDGLGYDVSTQKFDSRSGESQNVIAVKKPEGKDNAEIVYITAHYDSVTKGPGANDNGSGTSGMLEFARILKDIPTDKEIRFIAFGAEEIGLVGSRYYVGQLSQDEIDRSIANFNMDMIGTKWEPATQLFVNVVDGKPNTVWDQAKIASDKLGLEDGEIFLYKRGASDHVPFYDAGIPAANFIWREPGTASLEPWYHTAEDTIDKVSPEKIQFVGDLLSIAISDLLNP